MLKEANQELTLNQIEAAQSSSARNSGSRGHVKGRGSHRGGRKKSEGGFRGKRVDRGSMYVDYYVFSNMFTPEKKLSVGAIFLNFFATSKTSSIIMKFGAYISCI